MRLRHSRTGTTLLLAFGIAACSAVEPIPAGTPVTVTRLSSQPGSLLFYSDLRVPERLVIRDQVAWTAAWASLWPNDAPIPAPPQVDFTKDMIVLAALGQRSTGGYAILVDSARATSSGVVVFVGLYSPGPHCVTTQAFTQPVDIARLPRTDESVAFVDVAKVEDCQ